MKVKKNTIGSISIDGTSFIYGVEIEVSKELGSYIKNNFASTFTIVEDIKPAKKRVTRTKKD